MHRQNTAVSSCHAALVLFFYLRETISFIIFLKINNKTGMLGCHLYTINRVAVQSLHVFAAIFIVLHLAWQRLNELTAASGGGREYAA